MNKIIYGFLYHPRQKCAIKQIHPIILKYRGNLISLICEKVKRFLQPYKELQVLFDYGTIYTCLVKL